MRAAPLARRLVVNLGRHDGAAAQWSRSRWRRALAARSVARPPLPRRSAEDITIAESSLRAGRSGADDILGPNPDELSGRVPRSTPAPRPLRLFRSLAPTDSPLVLRRSRLTPFSPKVTSQRHMPVDRPRTPSKAPRSRTHPWTIPRAIKRARPVPSEAPFPASSIQWRSAELPLGRQCASRNREARRTATCMRSRTRPSMVNSSSVSSPTDSTTFGPRGNHANLG